MDDHWRYRSFFWPVVLIGVGVIWLLANLGLIETSSLAILVRLWPLLLIGIGLDIIFGRRWPMVGALLGLGLVAAVVVILVAAPNLGLDLGTDLRTEQFSAPLENATSVSVNLNLWSAPTTVGALVGSENLIEVDATYTGRINFQVSGDEQKTVSLSHDSTFAGPFSWFTSTGRERLDTRLSTAVPLELMVDSGSGSVDLDFSDLQLQELSLDSGSGSVEMDLPATGEPYPVEINSGSGSVSISLPDGAQPGLRIDSGSGSVTIDVPDGAALRVEVLDSGSGSVRLPSGLNQIESGDDDEGIWESDNFAGAEQGIVITLEDLGSGNVTVR